jgi:hypothetical protein
MLLWSLSSTTTVYYAHHLRKLQLCDEDARNLTTLERILHVFVGHLKYGNLTIMMRANKIFEMEFFFKNPLITRLLHKVRSCC